MAATDAAEAVQPARWSSASLTRRSSTTRRSMSSSATVIDSDSDSPRSQWSTGSQPESPRAPPASSEARVPYGQSKAAAPRVSWAGDVPSTAPTRETARPVRRSGAQRPQDSTAQARSGGNPLIRCSTVADVLGSAPAQPVIPEARSKAPAASSSSAVRELAPSAARVVPPGGPGSRGVRAGTHHLDVSSEGSTSRATAPSLGCSSGSVGSCLWRPEHGWSELGATGSLPPSRLSSAIWHSHPFVAQEGSRDGPTRYSGDSGGPCSAGGIACTCSSSHSLRRRPAAATTRSCTCSCTSGRRPAAATTGSAAGSQLDLPCIRLSSAG